MRALLYDCGKYSSAPWSPSAVSRFPSARTPPSGYSCQRQCGTLTPRCARRAATRRARTEATGHDPDNGSELAYHRRRSPSSRSHLASLNRPRRLVRSGALLGLARAYERLAGMRPGGARHSRRRRGARRSLDRPRSILNSCVGSNFALPALVLSIKSRWGEPDARHAAHLSTLASWISRSIVLDAVASAPTPG